MDLPFQQQHSSELAAETVSCIDFSCHIQMLCNDMAKLHCSNQSFDSETNHSSFGNLCSASCSTDDRCGSSDETGSTRRYSLQGDRTSDGRSVEVGITENHDDQSLIHVTRQLEASSDVVLATHSVDANFHGESSYLHKTNENMSPSTDIQISAIDRLTGIMNEVLTEPVNETVTVTRVEVTDDREPSLARVREWINSIEDYDIQLDEQQSHSKENDVHSEKGTQSSTLLIQAYNPDQIFANAAVQSLHPLSTVAHISGMGFREVPSLTMFSYLKTLNLSSNLIVRIPPGCFPRSLHCLDLSRNKIVQIEGLKELTRLRVLNLSYNKIARIGHGLASCAVLKELNLAGNKIAEIEGLHRLLKLSVLDLSFNKITTSKSLGQLAANYNSLLALNLLGNPVVSNLGEDQMQKLIIALSPRLMYLNRQPIKAVSRREAVLDNVAKAALGTHRSSKPIGTRATGKQGYGKVEAPLKSSRRHHHHSSHQKHKYEEKIRTAEHIKLFGLQDVSFKSRRQTMHRSKSESAFV